MGLPDHRRAAGGGLLPRAGETGNRLVADTRFFSWVSGADLCRLPGVDQEANPSHDEDCPGLERTGRGGSGAGGSAAGCLRGGAVPVPDFVGHRDGGPGALLWGPRAAQGAALSLARPAPGDSDSRYSFQPDNPSLADACFKAGQRPAAFVRGAGSARGERHRTARHEAGSRGGLQRHPLADEPVHARGLLWLLSGADRPAADDSCAGQHPHRDRGQCRAHLGDRAVRAVLGPRQGHGLLSRVLRLGDVSGFSGMPVCGASHHAGFSQKGGTA